LFLCATNRKSWQQKGPTETNLSFGHFVPKKLRTSLRRSHDDHEPNCATQILHAAKTGATFKQGRGAALQQKATIDHALIRGLVTA